MKVVNTKKLHENLTKRTTQDIERGTITGVQILVNQAGKRVYQAEFGTNGIHGEPLKQDTIYRIASMTKPVTTLAVLLEVEKGRIDLNAPITDYVQGYENLPIARLVDGELQVTGVNKTPIKVFHLLSHTSGIEMGDIITAVTAPMTEAESLP